MGLFSRSILQAQTAKAVDWVASSNTLILTGTYASSTLSSSTALISDANNNLISSNVTSTELGYVSGVTSAIQTQLNASALPSQTGNSGKFLTTNGTVTSWGTAGGTGTVTSVSVTTANGVSGSVATSTTTPAITLTLGAITPTSVNSIVLSGSATPTLAVTGTSTISGANTGDQTVTLTGAVTGSGAGSFATTIATPGTLTVSSTNNTATAHTHAITSSSTPGAAASLLATDASGIIGSTGTRIVKIWATDITATNAIAASVTGNAATVTTNANLTGAITSSGNATSLGSFSSANLAAAITDETGSGALVFANTPTLTTAVLGSSTATTQTPADNSTKLATTAYVDNAILGQDFKQAVTVATTTALATYVYNNGTSGVGATITLIGTGAVAFDGTTLTLGMPVLVKNETSTNTPNNGIYTVTQAGAIGVVLILTRRSDFNQSFEINAGDSVFVTSGTTQSATTWAYNGTSAPTMGTTNITFAQTAGQGAFVAGNGIAITGNSIAIDTSVTVDKTTVQTLSNKTFVAPALGTPASGVATNLTGTASSLTAGAATALATPRAINGTNFDGTAAITITAAAGTLTGATLASGVTASSLTSTGTITVGTWSSTITGATIDNTTTTKAYRPANTQTGTSYTLVLGDGGQMITLNNASAITLTIPANASVAFPVGTEIDLVQLGAGQVTVAITTDTLDSYTSKVKLAGQYAGGTLKKITSTSWVLIGNLA